MTRYHIVFWLWVVVGGVPLPASSAEVDPALRALLARNDAEANGILSTASQPGAAGVLPRGILTPSDAAGPEPRLDILLAAPSAPPGVSSILLSPGWYAVRPTLAELRELIQSNAVTAARLSRPLRPVLDRSSAAVGIAQVRRQDAGTGAYGGATGEGVVVGFVDSGVDWTHPDFLKPGGGTRISWFWDQRSPSGRPPLDFGFGGEWTADDIDTDNFLSRDLTGHGTHVLGIAAGNGAASFVPGEGSRYVGMAPRAEIIGVRTNFTEFGVATGVRYIFDRAGRMGLPAVVNLSVGSHFGPHRGNTPMERSLNGMVEPGHLLVAAAGNDAHRGFHAELSLAEGETGTLDFQFPAYTRDDPLDILFITMEGWFDPANRYRFTVWNPAGDEVGVYEFSDRERQYRDIRGIVRGWYTEDQGMTTLLLDIEDDPSSFRLATGTWQIRIEALVVEGDPELDFWVVNWSLSPQSELPAFGNFLDPEETVLSPASAAGVLAVGATATRACWPVTGGERCYGTPPPLGQVAFFSARGPTSDGREKPELLAPGFGVVSTLSSQISANVWTAEEIAERRAPEGPYWVSQGTSMSAPHITGTVALLLQRYPKLTHAQMVSRLRARGQPAVDLRSGLPVVALQTGAAVAPAVELALAETERVADGLQLTWFVGKELSPVAYRVHKGFSDEGPFHVLADTRITGTNPFQVVDTNLEPGRNHVYRISAVDELGLEDDLDTLRTAITGRPKGILRAPDPNPARSAVNLRFFLPPSPEGGRYRVEVIDIRGRRVSGLEEGVFGTDGEERVISWDLRDRVGRRVPSGIYLVHLSYQVGSSALPVSEAQALPGPASSTKRVVVLP